MALVAGITLAAGVFYYMNKPETAAVATVTPVQEQPRGTAFSMEQAPQLSLRGTLSDITGQPFWFSRTATEPASLLPSQTIQQGERILASESGTLTVTFGDAASLTIFPKADIEIIQTLPVNLVFGQRAGDAEYRATGVSPVSFRSYQALFTMQEGRVRVSIDPDTRTVGITVYEGAGKLVFNSVEFVTQMLTVQAGEQVLYDANSRSAEIF